MAVKNVVKSIALTSIDSATFTGSYQVINTNGLDQACFLLRIINNSNRDITVSYDGTTDNDFVPDASVLEIASQGNSQPNNFIALFSKGLKVYVKGTAGGTGLVYLVGYYQK